MNIYTSLIYKLICIVLFFSFASAQASDLDLSIGKSTNSRNMSYSVGISGSIFGQRVRFGYADLGAPRINRLVKPNAYADDVSAGRGPGPYYWIDPVRIKELYLTVDPIIYRGRFDYSMELGIAAYHPMWQQDLNASEGIPPHGLRTNITPIFGLVIGSGNTDVVLSVQDITEWGDWEHGTPRSLMGNISIRKRF